MNVPHHSILLAFPILPGTWAFCWSHYLTCLTCTSLLCATPSPKPFSSETTPQRCVLLERGEHLVIDDHEATVETPNIL